MSGRGILPFTRLPTLLLLALPIAACGGGPGASARALTVGATTTLEDSGLLDKLLAAFRTDRPDLRIRAVTGGTGEVLALARRGDLDVLLTHDAAAESAFVAEGLGEDHRVVLTSEFVVAGPAADPAGLASVGDPVDAFRRLASAGASFVSRADDSGTHRRERMLWRLALEGRGERIAGPARPGADRPPPGAEWYVEAGVGMGDALRVAGQRDAYILSDRPTFLMLAEEHGLASLVEDGTHLENPYGVIIVSGSPRAEAARAFADWLSSEHGRAVIEAFGRGRSGEPLFRVPAAP